MVWKERNQIFYLALPLLDNISFDSLQDIVLIEQRTYQYDEQTPDQRIGYDNSISYLVKALKLQVLQKAFIKANTVTKPDHLFIITHRTKSATFVYQLSFSIHRSTKVSLWNQNPKYNVFMLQIYVDANS